MYFTSIDTLFLPEFVTLYVTTEVLKSETKPREHSTNSTLNSDASEGVGLILPCRNRRLDGLTTSSLLATQ
jgi:hypothetical protein